LRFLCFRLEQLDRFRASFGPEAASSLLHVVAHTFEGALWKTDFVGRWSDDLFLVILHGCREDALHAVRDRVQRLLSDCSIAWWGERRSVPMSIGQATMQTGDTSASLMRRVEQSLNAVSHARACAAGSDSPPSSGS
jgi:GGDEF domain-containing protein